MDRGNQSRRLRAELLEDRMLLSADLWLTHGLTAKYFIGTDPNGTPAVTRTDPTINFDWGSGSPDAAVTVADNFAARWTGSIAGSGVSGGGALQNVAGVHQWSGAVTTTGSSTLLSASGALAITGTVAPNAAGQTLTLAGAGAGILTAVDSAGSPTNLQVLKSDAGEWVLNGACNNTGATTISAGTLIIKEVNKYQAGNITDNATLVMEHHSAATASFSKAISGAGTLVTYNSGTNTTPLILAASNSHSGDTRVMTGCLQTSVSGALPTATDLFISVGASLQMASYDETIRSLSGPGTVKTLNGYGSRTLTVGTAGAAYDGGKFYGTLQDDGAATLSLAKTGTGTLTLGGNNTYIGTTAVNAGALLITNGSALGTGSVSVASGASLQLQGGITVNNAISSIVGTGNSSSGGALESLSGNNIWSGSIAVGTAQARITSDADTLTVSGNIALAAGGAADQLALLANGTSTTLLVSGTISGGNSGFRTLIKASNGGAGGTGTGTVILAGANTYAGLTGVGLGTLQIGNGGTSGVLGTDSVELYNNGTLAFDRSDACTYAGLISGAGSVTQIGSGTTTLSRANTYTGTTNVNAGTLAISGSLSSSTSTVTVNSGGTLAGAGTISRPVSIASGGILSPGGDSVGTLSPDGTYVPSVGSSIVFLDNDSTDAISGQFSSGTSVTVGGHAMTLSYTAGTGNEFAITHTSLLAATVPTRPASTGTLTEAELASIVAEAIARWGRQGISATQIAVLRSVQVVIADLPAQQLGERAGNAIAFDTNGAGWGWFVDATPGRDEEFLGRGPVLRAIDRSAVDRMDLLSVVEHELGHVLGYDDMAVASDVMGAALSAGTRRTTHRQADLALLGLLESNGRDSAGMSGFLSFGDSDEADVAAVGAGRGQGCFPLGKGASAVMQRTRKSFPTQTLFQRQ
jgi:autotransporter-associated beta strand protein